MYITLFQSETIKYINNNIYHLFKSGMIIITLITIIHYSIILRYYIKSVLCNYYFPLIHQTPDLQHYF